MRIAQERFYGIGPCNCHVHMHPQWLYASNFPLPTGSVVNRGHCRIKLIRHFIENTRLFQGQLQSGTQITKTGTMMFKAE